MGLKGKWVKFNWAENGAVYPDGADPFGEELGSGGCVARSKICRGRIPGCAKPLYLASEKSKDGAWAVWKFDGSAKANKILQAMQNHTQVCSRANEGVFTPIKSSGKGWGCGKKCKVFSYNDGNGKACDQGHKSAGTGGWSMILDDDGHWCNPAFKMGATVHSRIKNDYGYANSGCGTKVGGALYYWDEAVGSLMCPARPTATPTELPTHAPTRTPTEAPTTRPSSPSPSHTPTEIPTQSPTLIPTLVPTTGSPQPKMVGCYSTRTRPFGMSYSSTSASGCLTKCKRHKYFALECPRGGITECICGNTLPSSKYKLAGGECAGQLKQNIGNNKNNAHCKGDKGKFVQDGYNMGGWHRMAVYAT
jgi:hypothetical protein